MLTEKMELLHTKIDLLVSECKKMRAEQASLFAQMANIQTEADHFGDMVEGFLTEAKK